MSQDRLSEMALESLPVNVERLIMITRVGRCEFGGAYSAVSWEHGVAYFPQVRGGDERLRSSLNVLQQFLDCQELASKNGCRTCRLERNCSSRFLSRKVQSCTLSGLGKTSTCTLFSNGLLRSLLFQSLALLSI